MTSIDYDYAMSGIPAVLVGFTGKGGDDIRIERVHELHDLLAHAVATKPCRLGPKEFRFLRGYLGLTQKELAKLVHLHPDTIKWLETDTRADDTGQMEYIFRILTLIEIKTTLPSVQQLLASASKPYEEVQYRVDASDPLNYRMLPGT
jgi:DNA-binding XRE family transcriptional regulator